MLSHGPLKHVDDLSGGGALLSSGNLADAGQKPRREPHQEPDVLFLAHDFQCITEVCRIDNAYIMGIYWN